VADLTRTVDVVLNGENHLSRKFRVATTSARKFAGVLGTGGTAAGAAGTVAGGAAAATAALAALGGYASGKLAQGLAEAYGEFAQFETSLKDLEKVLGDQPEKMEQAKKAAQDMAVKYGVASEKIVDSMAGWVQAGYSIDEAMTLAEDTIAATYASELNMQDATTTLTKILKGFGVEVDNARSKLDAVNEISNNYAASVSQLSEGLGRAAPVAKSMGFSMEELASVMTPAIEKFQNGRRVGTAYKTMLTKLQSDTTRVTEALDTLGVKQRDANGQFKSGKEIFYEVGEAFQDLDKTQKAHIATQIAGREHAAKLLATFNSWDKAAKVYETAMDSTGSITEEVENRLQAASTQMDRFQTAGKVLAQVIGGQVAESFTEVIGSATDLVGALQEAIESGGASEFFERINEMADDLAKYLGDIADVMPEAFEQVDFGALAGAVESVGQAFGDWFSDLDLTKPDDLAEALQRLVDGASRLIDTFSTFVSWGDEIMAVLLNMGKGTSQISDVLSSVNSFWDIFIVAAGTAVGAYERFLKALDYVPGLDLSGAITSVHKFGTRIANMQLELEKAKKEQKEQQQAMQDTGEAAKKGEDAVHGFENVIRSVTEGKHRVDLKASADKESAEEAGELIKEEVPEKVKVKAEAETKQAQIEKEMAKIEAEAETAQKAMEMEAKVEVAKAEASMEKFKSAAESTAAAISETTSQMDTLFGYISDPGAIMSPSFYREVQDMIQDEHESRQKLLDKQAKLTQKQIDLMEERAQAMRNGEGLIKIDAEGLEPSLEILFTEILEKIQIQASEEAQNLLLPGA